MKVLLLCVVCAVVGDVAGGAVAWPGAAISYSSPVLKTFLPAQTKAFGFSTTQYINSLPLSYNPYVHPQFTYQVPHFSGISAIQPGFLPAPGHTYYPASIFYPQTPITLPPQPSQPAPPNNPQQPTEQPAGDSDTAVVDSADYTPQSQQSNPTEAPQTSTPSAPANGAFPNFPQIPQNSEQPLFPQIPQISSQPSFPQFPQLPAQIPFPQIPQFPQGSAPGFPQFPQLPQIPMFPQSPSPSPPSSFPGDANGDKGLNDEDTISVESA